MAAATFSKQQLAKSATGPLLSLELLKLRACSCSIQRWMRTWRGKIGAVKPTSGNRKATSASALWNWDAGVGEGRWVDWVMRMMSALGRMVNRSR